MNLLDFPDDILIEILRLLDGDSVYSCSMVCKRLQAHISNYKIFEYQYRLEKQDLVDTCKGDRSFESRIAVLKHFTKLWWWSESRRVPTDVYRIEGRCIAYELVAGVFAKTDGSSLLVQWLPSFLAPARQIVHTQKDFGFSIKDFALDPTQDVIVYIEADNLFSRAREIVLHVRTLSTNVHHPEAHQPTVRVKVPYDPLGNDISAVTIQLADDLLSIFYSSGPSLPRLLLWDWKTATIILNSFDLPPGTHSFELLSSRSYAILSTAQSGSIYVYNIHYPTNPLVRPFCVARLLFPSLIPGIRLVSILSHTGPFLARPRRNGIFTTAPDSRVYVITASFLNTTRTHATFFIHASAFAPYTRLNEPEAGFLAGVPWPKWTSGKCSIAAMQPSTNWLRYVHGTRVVMSKNQELGNVSILDFNLTRGHVENNASNNFDLFVDDVQYIPPPRKRMLSVRSLCSAWMVDEGFVLGLNTAGSFEERIQSLEVFSMYHNDDC